MDKAFKLALKTAKNTDNRTKLYRAILVGRAIYQPFITEPELTYDNQNLKKQLVIFKTNIEYNNFKQNVIVAFCPETNSIGFFSEHDKGVLRYTETLDSILPNRFQKYFTEKIKNATI